MAWYLNRALSNFRAAVNAAYPKRDKASDGTIGDEAHQSGSSDHNPDGDGSVDAWDMDVNLRSSNDAAAIAELKRVFQAHPSSKYWIHNDQIARRDYGWRRESYAYAGPNRNRHTQHVHWNTRESYEDSTAPWNVEDDMGELVGDQAKMLEATNERVRALAQLVETITTGWSSNPTGKESVPAVAALKAATKLGPALTAIQDHLGVIDQAVTELAARPTAGTVVTDEQLERALRKVIGSVDGASPQG